MLRMLFASERADGAVAPSTGMADEFNLRLVSRMTATTTTTTAGESPDHGQ
ncbi:MAG TPA: hypothetical protein VHB46_16725 [Burkholderiales bacterium]|nr:hypothetical protein [Burkholderiales bacterium]